MVSQQPTLFYDDGSVYREDYDRLMLPPIPYPICVHSRYNPKESCTFSILFID